MPELSREHKLNNDDLVYHIATMTMSSKITDCELNLVNIGKYLELDRDIIGIKYTYGNICFSRGIYTTTNYKKSKKKEKTKINQQLFYNQISLVVDCSNMNLFQLNSGLNKSESLLDHARTESGSKQINVKLFGNGSLHITGCKSEYDGKYVTELVYNKLKMISYKTHTIILSSNSYGVLLDSNNFIYKQYKQLNENDNSSTKNSMYYNIIGFYDQKTNLYVMNNKEYVVFNKIKNSFISKKNDLQKMKSICNNNSDVIGVFSYCKNKKQNIIKLNDVIDMNKNETISTDYNNYRIIEYKCNPFLNKNFNTYSEYPDSFTKQGVRAFTLQDPGLSTPEWSKHDDTFHKYVLDNIKVNIDCINITYQLPYLINRNKLYEFFIDNNYICKYNPQTYSGIKFIYKLPFHNINCKFETFHSDDYLQKDQNKVQNKNGICKCNVKCICLNITFLIFRSGNIIITGFKDVQQIKSVLHEFNNIMKKFN